MRIELCAGGIGGISVLDYQTDMRSFLSEKESVIASFKAVSTSTGNLSGGVGSLQDALEHIQSRIVTEETALSNARSIQTSMNDFLELAQRVDTQVASDVNRNKEDFYGKYPELRPAPPEEEKAWYEKAWEALCGAGEAIQEAIEDGLEFIADTLKKAWDGLVAFYNEHKKIIDTVLLIVGAIGAIAAVIATGGLALAPLLGALGLSASVAAAVSTAVAVVAVVSTVAATALNVADVWLEIDNPIFNAIQTGLNITSAVTNFAYSIGNLYNSFKGINPKNYVKNSSDIDAQGIPNSQGGKMHPDSGKAPGKQPDLNPVDDSPSPNRRTWQGSEDNVDGFLGDDYHKQISIKKDDMTSGHYGEKGTIRLDDVRGEIGGKVQNLDELDNLSSIEHFDVAEVKNYSIENSSGRSNLKKNILNQAAERNEVLSQSGATVNQTYYIDTTGHDITIGEWEKLYYRLVNNLPDNVDIFPMWK